QGADRAARRLGGAGERAGRRRVVHLPPAGGGPGGQPARTGLRPLTAAPRSLVPHPDSPAGPVRTLQVEAERQGTALALHYVLDGRLSEILTPPRAKPARTDDLWKHTCFEAFVR